MVTPLAGFVPNLVVMGRKFAFIGQPFF